MRLELNRKIGEAYAGLPLWWFLCVHEAPIGRPEYDVEDNSLTLKIRQEWHGIRRCEDCTYEGDKAQYGPKTFT